jgi:nitroreductase
VSETSAGEPGLFEIIHTARSMRRLKPDPVPDALIRKILEAGVCAPSGGNMQRWRFLVIKDREVKEDVAVYYRRAWEEHVKPGYRSSPPPAGSSPERFARMLDAAQYLADHLHEAPVWIVPCLEGVGVWGQQNIITYWDGASIYPAVQNMLLAARALGLGATLTTLVLRFAQEIGAALHLPSDARAYALLPIGYPLGRFGPVRRSIDNVVYEDRWGEPYTR